MNNIIERLFRVTDSGSTVKTELIGGFTTFFAMSYIIFVQPAILSETGMDFGAVTCATCISCFAAIIAMGILTNYPIALAPGMGQNIFFAYTVCAAVSAGGMGFTWQEALSGVFWAGVLFLIITFMKVQTKLINILPDNLKYGISGGIGLLIALLGLKWAGIIVADPGAITGLGNLKSPPVLLSIFGLFLTSILLQRRVPGAILIGIIATSLAGIPFNIFSYQGVVSLPPSIDPTLLKFDLFGIFRNPEFLTVILMFFFLDIFDTMGTLVGLADFAGFYKEGKIPKAGTVLKIDAAGTVFGAALGTSTLTSYLESATGIAAGAKTGLANIVTGMLFLASLFFYPLVSMIGGGFENPNGITLYPSIAPVLILVGCFIIKSVIKVKWDEPIEAVPAFLTILVMGLSSSIPGGLAFGFVSYSVIALFTGKSRDVHPAIYFIALLFILRYVFL
ncbi:MAG: NCS2 family permease [bacterium]|nr:NCS2 family permease [bacterium]